MKVGIALNISHAPERIGAPPDPAHPDAALVRDHLALGDLVEPLGLDSIWALEHHFTGYSMSPDPTQMLSYYAARTHRVELGTAVIVLPWHDPVRVAEEIALLDILSGGRAILGFGRGIAKTEYEGFRIPMEESRERFVEAAQIIHLGLSQPVFEFQGKHFQIPRTSIRPRPVSHPERRMYASSVSPESGEIMAKLGLGVMVIVQKSWPDVKADLDRYRATARESGHPTRPPILLLSSVISESAEEADELANRYIPAAREVTNRHYGFTEGYHANVKGYEFYGKMARTYQKFSDPEVSRRATDFVKELQIVGTPERCLEHIREIHRLTNADHMVLQFTNGGVPYHLAERMLRLFATRVAPTLQRDPAFAPLPEEALV